MRDLLSYLNNYARSANWLHKVIYDK